MVDVKPKEDLKVENPATHFDKPNDVVHAANLSPDEKKKALNTREQDARQLLTASNEGMTGSEGGAHRTTITASVKSSKRRIRSEKSRGTNRLISAGRCVGDVP